MRASESPYPHRHERPPGGLRLQLAPEFTRASAAGVWRPHSRDLTREGPQLVEDFPRGRGRIDRLAYSPGDWDVVADEVFTNRGRIKVGFLPPEQAGGLVLVRLLGTGIIRLRVEWAAARLLDGVERSRSPEMQVDLD